MSDDFKELPSKTARKIKAAVTKAVGFWKQIQLILGEFQDETKTPSLQKLVRDLNSEICQELTARPGGTTRSREIAEVMGLSHQQLKTVAEIYNPGCFGKIGHRYQLNSGRVFDIRLGSDLRKPAVQKEVKNYIRNVQPGLVLLAPPCRMFSQLQNLSKNKRETDIKLMNQYLHDREEAQQLLDFAIEICQLCLKLGIKFVLEHPHAATSWKQPKMARLLADGRVLFSRADQCQYGLRGDGGPHRKATGFATNDENIHEKLQRRCRGEHEHEHIIGGTRSKKCQEYPEELLQSILRGYQRTVKEQIEIVTDEQVLKENYYLDESILEAWRLCGAEGERAEEYLGDDQALPEQDDLEQGQLSGRCDGHDYRQGQVQELMAMDEPSNEEEAQEEGEPEVVAVDGETHDLPLQSRFGLKRLLQRAHEGLGHPSTEKFIRILRYSKANQKLSPKQETYPAVFVDGIVQGEAHHYGNWNSTTVSART